MKIKKILLGFALLASVALVVTLNQSVASAQETTVPAGVSCGAAVWPHERSYVDSSTSSTCGSCFIYTVRAGYNADTDDISTKYDVKEVSAKGSDTTCAEDDDLPRTQSCDETVLDGTVNCPPAPTDLDPSNEGTSTGTTTGTATSTL